MKTIIISSTIFLLSLIGIQTEAQSYSLSITNPSRDGQQVNCTYKVEGVVQKPSGEHAWIMVHRKEVFQYVWWPQGEVISDPSGVWHLTVTLGNQADIGYDFELALIIVDAKEHVRLSNYMTQAMVTGHWTPMPMPKLTTAPIYRSVTKISHNM